MARGRPGPVGATDVVLGACHSVAPAAFVTARRFVRRPRYFVRRRAARGSAWRAGASIMTVFRAATSEASPSAILATRPSRSGASDDRKPSAGPVRPMGRPTTTIPADDEWADSTGAGGRPSGRFAHHAPSGRNHDRAGGCRAGSIKGQPRIPTRIAPSLRPKYPRGFQRGACPPLAGGRGAGPPPWSPETPAAAGGEGETPPGPVKCERPHPGVRPSLSLEVEAQPWRALYFFWVLLIT